MSYTVFLIIGLSTQIMSLLDSEDDYFGWFLILVLAMLFLVGLSSTRRLFRQTRDYFRRSRL